MIVEFIHFAGIIIGLGAVTVIDSLGFISRKSIPWTQTTIKAHHVTKPLIWIGTFLMTFSWLFMFNSSLEHIIKSILIIILILNGIFLSFYVSPRLDQLSNKKKLLPNKLQQKIIISVIVSFLCWWSLVYITLM